MASCARNTYIKMILHSIGEHGHGNDHVKRAINKIVTKKGLVFIPKESGVDDQRTNGTFYIKTNNRVIRIRSKFEGEFSRSHVKNDQK